MTEKVTIRRPDGTKKAFELNDEGYITVEPGENGKPSVLMKLSKELVSTAKPEQSK